MPPKLFSDTQLRNRDLDTIKSWLRWKIGGYRVMINDTRAGNVIFRGVVAAEMPATINRISYPPAELVTKLGRANRIGHSLFYSSVAGPACFYELKAIAGQRIALAKWTVLEPLWMHNLGFHPHALKRLGVTDSGRARFAHPIPNESKENERMRLQLSLAFTANVPDGSEHLYKQSIAIFENLFDKAEALPTPTGGSRFNRPAGVVYPAMQLRGAADNLALFPQFVDQTLRLESVQYLLVEEADPTRSAYTLLTLATSNSSNNGTLLWTELTGPEIDRRTFISLDDGHWIMRNGHGAVYFRR